MAKKRLYPWLGTALVVLILGVATFFRFYHLSTLPPGLHPDEAANGLDIIRMIDHHDFRVLYDTNGPREALFFYFQAIFVLLFGFKIVSLRIAPALFGVASVFGVYLLTKNWFGRRTALIASFLMAVDSWVVIINHDGFRANLAPFFMIWVAWAYTHAIRTKARKWFVLAGALLGLGFYTYPSYRSIILVMLLFGGFAYIKDRKLIRQYAKPVLLSWVVAAIVLIPLGIYGIHQPGEVLGTRGSVSIFNKDINGGSPVKTLVGNVGKTALMFFTHGDDNARQNDPGAPMLDIFTGIFLIAGFLLSLLKIFKAKYFVVLAWFGAAALPMVLTAEGIPHGLRAVAMIPATFMLAAIGANWLINVWKSKPLQKLALVAVAAAMFASLYLNYQKVFVAWADSPLTYKAYADDMVAIANYAKSQPPAEHLELVIGGYGEMTVQYLTHNSGVLYHRDEVADLPKATFAPGAYNFVIESDWVDQALSTLKQNYPGGVTTTFASPHDPRVLFVVYSVRIK